MTLLSLSVASYASLSSIPSHTFIAKMIATSMLASLIVEILHGKSSCRMINMHRKDMGIDLSLRNLG